MEVLLASNWQKISTPEKIMPMVGLLDLPRTTLPVPVGADFPDIHFKTRAGQGAYTALPIWAGFFTKLYNDERFSNLKTSRFSIPESVSAMMYCQDYIELPELKVIRTDASEIEE